MKNRLNVFRVWLLIVLGSATVCFHSCKKDDAELVSGAFDGKIIVAGVVNPDEYFSHAQVVQVRVMKSYLHTTTFASANYTGGGFTLTLPQTMSDGDLYSIENEDSIFPTENVSDKKARIAIVDIYAYDADNELMGGFYESNDADKVGVLYVYTDRDVTVQSKRHSVSMKRGWNKVYEEYQMSGLDIISTKPLEGLKWFYYSYIH